MKKVLWVSRHPLDPKAIQDLEGLFGPVEVSTQDVLFSNDSLESFQQLMDIGSGFDIVGGVFPSQLWVALVNYKSKIPFTLFITVAVPVAAADSSKSRDFVYDHLEIVYKS